MPNSFAGGGGERSVSPRNLTHHSAEDAGSGDCPRRPHSLCTISESTGHTKAMSTPPEPRKTRFRPLAKLCRVGVGAPQGSIERFQLCSRFLLSQACLAHSRVNLLVETPILDTMDYPLRRFLGDAPGKLKRGRKSNDRREFGRPACFGPKLRCVSDLRWFFQLAWRTTDS